MGLRTADEYRARRCGTGACSGIAVRACRACSTNPDLRVAVDHSAIDFEASHDPAHEPLAVAVDPDTGERYSAYYRIPRSTDDLLARMQLVERTTALGGTLLSIKDVGSDAMFALLGLLQDDELVRLPRLLRPGTTRRPRGCRRPDRREGRPHQGAARAGRPRPPLHVVDRSDEGIVVRGAKVHTSLTPNCNEFLVLPTRAMRAEDADFAIAFAVEPSTPGLSMYVSPYSAGDRHPWEHPVSSKHKMLETLTVFDDVFVPWERVFCFRRPELAGPIALAFVEYHRFTAVSYKLPLLDAFVGCAAEIARMNGVHRREPHPRQAHAPGDLQRDGAHPDRGRGAARASGDPTATAGPTAPPRTSPSTRSPPASTRRCARCRTARAACSPPDRAATTGTTPRSGPCSRSTSRPRHRHASDSR